MGSWNLSCAVTRFPVDYDDAIRAIFVARNPRCPEHPGGLLYGTDLWAPISLPIAVTYDDYGRMNPADEADWRLSMLLEGLGGLPFDTLLERIYEGDLFLPGSGRGPQDVPMTVGVMVIHEQVYQRLIENFYDLGQHTTPSDLHADNSELFRHMREMEHYNSFMLPETGTLTFWFQNRSSGATVAVLGIDSPSPRDVVPRIRAARTMQDAAPEMAATCEMFVLNENLDALGVPYLPTMQASDDFDPDLLRELQDIAMGVYKRE